MKRRSLWRTLGFLALWLFIGGIAILKFAPEFFSARDAAPDTTATSPASDVPPLDEAPAPHFYATDNTTAGSAAPTEVDRTSDTTPGDAPLFGLAGAAAPAAAAPEPGSPAPWQYDTSASPGAAAPETDVAYGPNMAAGGAAPDLPGAPTPNEPTEEVTSSPNTGGVGEGDAIDEPSADNPDSIGLSGIGAGGGGSGDGIGLGNIGTIGHGGGDRPDLGEIGDLKSGGGSGRVFGYGRASSGAPAKTRSIAVDTTDKPPLPPDATIGASDDAMSEVDRKLAALPLGDIAFNTPEAIPLGDTATIELVASLKEAEEQLRQQVHGAGPVETAHDIKFADQMEAKVTGLGFCIEPITPERQAVSHTQETRWRWQIEPTKSDTLELNLTLSALIKIDGEPSARAIRTFEKTIVVKVPFGQRVVTAMSNNVELLTSVVLIPVAGGTWRYFRKRKRRKTAPDNETAVQRHAA
jgi:hypothetical protein